MTLAGGGEYTITATKPTTLETGTSASFTVSRIFYASNAGNDATGDGTLAKPFLTIGQGVTTAIAGDTVQALAGTYVEAVNVTKSLLLLGSGASTTTIEAPAGLCDERRVQLRVDELHDGTCDRAHRDDESDHSDDEGLHG